MEDIINLGGTEYRILEFRGILPEQREFMIKRLGEGSVKGLGPAASCLATTKNVGETVTLKASGRGGTAPYTLVFLKGGVELTRVSPLAEGQEQTYSSPITSADAGKSIAFGAYVIDSCPTGAKQSPTETCTISVPSVCTIPACSLTVS